VHFFQQNTLLYHSISLKMSWSIVKVTIVTFVKQCIWCLNDQRFWNYMKRVRASRLTFLCYRYFAVLNSLYFKKHNLHKRLYIKLFVNFQHCSFGSSCMRCINNLWHQVKFITSFYYPWLRGNNLFSVRVPKRSCQK